MANIPVGIGCGGRGRGHVRALHALEGVELVAVLSLAKKESLTLFRTHVTYPLAKSGAKPPDRAQNLPDH